MNDPLQIVRVLLEDDKSDDPNPYNDRGCPICGKHAVGHCRCSGLHTMEELKKGHGMKCQNGHRFSGSLVFDPSVPGEREIDWDLRLAKLKERRGES